MSQDQDQMYYNECRERLHDEIVELRRLNIHNPVELLQYLLSLPIPRDLYNIRYEKILAESLVIEKRIESMKAMICFYSTGRKICLGYECMSSGYIRTVVEFI